MIEFSCDVCNEKIGTPEDMTDNSTVEIITSKGPLTILFNYGYGQVQNETFRPNTAAVCQRCVMLQIQADLEEE